MMEKLCRRHLALAFLASGVLSAGSANSLLGADSWAQFRGPQGAARSDSTHKLPQRMGLQTNVVWKVKSPAGHSSPVLSKEHIYLTAVQDGKLLTRAVNRSTGKLLWQAVAPYAKLEAIHRIAGKRRVCELWSLCKTSRNYIQLKCMQHKAYSCIASLIIRFM